MITSIYGHLQSVAINPAGNLRLTIESEKEEGESRYLKEQSTKEHYLGQKTLT